MKMQKKAFLALMLALCLLLSGCTLIVKDEAVDAATVIIRKGDTVVTKGELKTDIDNLLNNMSYYYAAYGYPFDPTDETILADARNQVIQQKETDIVTAEQLAANQLDQLTDEENADIQEKAQSAYDSMVSSYKSTVSAEQPDADDETLTKMALDRMAELGLTLETYVEDQKKTLLDSKLRDFIVKDVTVTEEELQTEYESRVASSKSTYENNPGAYATAVNNGTTVYFVPEGVRRVKQILTKFHEEDQTAIDAANARVTEANSAISAANAKISSLEELAADENAEEAEKAQANEDLTAAREELAKATEELDAANAELTAATDTGFANLDEEVDAILAELESGADWDTLMAEKNQDPGMQSGTAAEKGYAIATGMTSFDAAFVEAGMALEKIGDWSGKIKGNSYGYYIIRYVDDEKPGEVGLDAVRETIGSSVLANKQNTTYDTTVQQWITEAGFQVDMNALKD